jgi:hypothetical protein
MDHVLQLSAPIASGVAPSIKGPAPPVRLDGIYVVFTTFQHTLEAVRVASALAESVAAPLTVVHFRAVPYPLSVDAPAGVSPAETDEFVDRVRAEGIDVKIRVYLCRNEWRTMPMAFREHSLIVIGGRGSWWPTRAERLRRRLERDGHFVVFVNAFRSNGQPHA